MNGLLLYGRQGKTVKLELAEMPQITAKVRRKC